MVLCLGDGERSLFCFALVAKFEVTAPSPKIVAIWHNLSVFCSLNEISTERNSQKVTRGMVYSIPE
ncbi:MAG: hypothetical protein RMY28_028165 [Nostoc sp. ChiSLP01]